MAGSKQLPSDLTVLGNLWVQQSELTNSLRSKLTGSLQLEILFTPSWKQLILGLVEQQRGLQVSSVGENPLPEAKNRSVNQPLTLKTLSHSIIQKLIRLN